MKWLLPLLFLIPGFAQADLKHELVRRVAVFPIADFNGNNADEAWWQMREGLTKDQRFFVAGRRFMINRGVFQARKSLKPADAIILGKILDAQALVTSYVEDRRFFIKIFEAENGSLIWEGKIDFHPALPIADQIVKVSQNMMTSFLSEVPYQGFTVVDPVKAKTVFDESGRNMAYVFIGTNSGVEVGDPVQWIEVRAEGGKPQLQGGGQMTVVGEGKVVSLREDQALVEITKVRDPADIFENSLVRLPKEVKRLKESFGDSSKDAKLTAEYLTSEMKPLEDHERRHSKTSTSLAFILNFAALVLLAF